MKSLLMFLIQAVPYWYTIWIQELGLYLTVLPAIYLFVLVLLIQI